MAFVVKGNSVTISFTQIKKKNTVVRIFDLETDVSFGLMHVRVIYLFIHSLIHSFVERYL